MSVGQIKILIIPNAGKDAEKLGHSCIADESVKQCGHFGK